MYFYFLFLLKHLSLERRIHYSNELIRNGWLEDTAVVSDNVIESLYTAMLSELMAGHSPEFEGSSNHTDSDRTVVYDEDAVGGVGLTTLTNVAMTTPPSSPSTPPPSQLRRRGPFDIGELATAASTAARATAWIAPDASSALAALAAAASAIAGTESAEAHAEPVPSTNGASAATDASASMEPRQRVPESTGMEAATAASASEDVAGSPPLYFEEIASCIICTEEMHTPGVTNSCRHRDCCRRCLWIILREGDRRCPLCRREYQRVW